jgi:nucleoside-diphosphate-sugar epimerase
MRRILPTSIINCCLADQVQVHEQVFYMADYEPLSLRDYANRLADAMEVKRSATVPLPLAKVIALCGDLLNACGVRFPYNSFRLKNIRTEYIFDMSKTQAVCGDLPKTFEGGVRETAYWYLKKP